jgi:CubicO group peptidase (beta-lactamase class C family)
MKSILSGGFRIYGKNRNSGMKKLVCFFLLTILVMFCGSSDNIITDSYEYQTPVNTGDGLQTSYLNSEGMDPIPIIDLIKLVLKGTYNHVHGILIAKNNKLVLEEYFENYTRNTLHMIASCTKSITSALIGIAIDNGYIKNVDQKLFYFFPEYRHLWSIKKDKIKLDHLLTMTAGFDWDETSTDFKTDPSNTLYQMVRSNSWTEFVLERSVISTPGEIYNYCCGCSILLGSILYNTTGVSADKLAEDFLFKPLGISDYTWYKQPDDLPQTEGGLELRPRDMLKFGLLFLNKGVWKGKRIISKKWIMESTKKHLDYAENIGYAYHWHTQDFRVNNQTISSIRASGWKGQFIYIFPILDMVVVFTMFNDNSHGIARDMISRYILRAALGE